MAGASPELWQQEEGDRAEAGSAAGGVGVGRKGINCTVAQVSKEAEVLLATDQETIRIMYYITKIRQLVRQAD